jgi:hypothetical protein
MKVSVSRTPSIPARSSDSSRSRWSLSWHTTSASMSKEPAVRTR